ncbi:MAG: TolC family protein, partial [Planctomycetaceae bacterium]|nr:TolC family protein [Planctomycetaceae bacterium]
AVLAAQRTVSVAQDLKTIVEKGVETAKELEKGGEVPQTDVLQAELELNAVEILLQNARQQEQGVRRELAAVLGIPELPSGEVIGNLDQETKSVDFEMEWQKIQSASPLLQMAQMQIEQARAQIERERVQPIPDVQVQASLMHDFAGDQALLGTQIGLMLPIHNKNQGNIAAAESALYQAVENLSRLEFALRQELADAVRRFEMAQSQVELYREKILPKAQQTLDLTTKGYQAGEIDFLRVLTAQRTYVENQVDYIAALAELQSAQVQIDGLLITGGLKNPSQLLSQPGSNRNPVSIRDLTRPTKAN